MRIRLRCIGKVPEMFIYIVNGELQSFILIMVMSVLAYLATVFYKRQSAYSGSEYQHERPGFVFIFIQ